MTRYVITSKILLDSRRIPVDESTFKDAVDAQRATLETLGLEEKANFVLGNYRDFERHLLDLAIDRVIYNLGGWSEFMGALHDINRRLVNLLTSGRLYLDQMQHTISSLYGDDSSEYEEVTQATSRQYDDRFGYRLMEALRNYSQHRDLPVHKLSYPSWADKRGESRRLRCSVAPFLKPKKLAEDPGFKTSVLTELKSRGEEIDLRPLVREYVAGLLEIHGDVRDAIGDDHKTRTAILRAILDRWEEEYGEKGKNIGVAIVDDNGEITEFHGVFLKPANRIEEMRRQIRSRPAALSKMVITSELQEE